MTILNITINVIEPLNILPNGKMDQSKSVWKFGGTIYKVACTTAEHEEYHPDTHFNISVQLEGELWYSPDCGFSSKSLMEVLEYHYNMDIDYKGYVNDSSN